MWPNRYRLFALVVILSLGGCAFSPQNAAPESVPLPRSRPKALARHPQLKPSGEESPEIQEKMSRNSEPARKWRLCKLLYSDGLAQRTDDSIDSILAAALAGCSTTEQELKAWIAQRTSPAVAEAIVEKMRIADQEQITSRIMALRQQRLEAR